MAASACLGPSFGGSAFEPAVLLGPRPTTILILPPVGGGDNQDAALALMTSCERALSERGYVPIPAEVGLQILEERGFSIEVPVPTDEANRYRAVPDAARGLAVDACLAIEIRAWDAFWRAGIEAVDYDITFRLLEANRGQLLFERTVSASWNWHGRRSPSLIRELDSFTGTDELPESPYRTTYDFVQQIAERLVRSLPPGQ